MVFTFDQPPSTGHQDIGILLTPEFSMMCLSSVTEPLRAANRTIGADIYRRRLFGLDGLNVIASNGLSLRADEILTAETDVPLLLICSSFNPDRYWTPGLAHTLLRLRGRGTAFGGLDTGSILLARSGLLDGYRATVHWELLEPFAEEFPEVDVVPDRFVVDRNRLSAGGGATAMDLMLAMIRAQHGHFLAHDVASQFIYEHDLSASDPQMGIAARQVAQLAPNLSRVLELMESHLEEPMSLPGIRAELDMGAKELDRLFQRHLNSTPGKYYRHLRLTRAQRMMYRTSLSIAEIAVRTGFNSPAAFSRAYRNRYGHAPSSERS